MDLCDIGSSRVWCRSFILQQVLLSLRTSQIIFHEGRHGIFAIMHWEQSPERVHIALPFPRHLLQSLAAATTLRPPGMTGGIGT